MNRFFVPYQMNVRFGTNNNTAISYFSIGIWYCFFDVNFGTFLGTNKIL